MYDITLERENAQGEMISETHEGVVDFMDPPGNANPRLKFKNEDGWQELVGFDRIARIESPLA